MTILPFLGSNRKKRKVMAQEVKEFSELVKDQYTFLMQQLEKVLKDYFDLSSKVKEMHTEIFSLRDQLAQAAALQCINKECRVWLNRTFIKEHSLLLNRKESLFLYFHGYLPPDTQVFPLLRQRKRHL